MKETGQPAPGDFPDEVLQKLAIDGFGNRYVAGFSYNGSDYDIRILKYDSRGALIWDQSYDSGNHDYAYAVTVNPDDENLYVGGCQLDGLNYKAVLLRYDLAGVRQFAIQNPGNSQAKAYYDLAVDERGIYAVGENYNGNNFDAIVALHGFDGSLIWETSRAATDTEAAYAIKLMACDNECGVVIAGVTGVDRGTGWVDLVNPSAGSLSPLATISDFGIFGLAPSDNGVVIGGSTPANDWVLAAIDAEGDVRWRTTVVEGERLRGLASDRNGYIYAAGSSPGSGDNDGLISLLSPAGDMLGSQTYDQGVSETLTTLAIGPEGLVTAAGHSGDPLTRNRAFLLLNYNTGKSFLPGLAQRGSSEKSNAR